MPLHNKQQAISVQTKRDEISKKKGPHGKVYLLNGDEYIGEWDNNMKHGRGKFICYKTGAVYEGEWRYDKRHGYGCFSIPRTSPTQPKVRDSAPAGLPTRQTKLRSTSFDPPKRKAVTDLMKVYAGDWCEDKMHGIGTYYYQDGSSFEGMWVNNKREGWGTMLYSDGSRYDGEFFNDMRHGQGILLLPNSDRYEGMWVNDKKEGPGKFIYKSKGQYYEGEWSQNIPKCGIITDIPPHPRLKQEATRRYPLPKLELANPDEVLREQREEILKERLARFMATKAES